MRSNTRKRPGPSGSPENGHTTPEPQASSPNLEGGSDIKKPPSKKRKLDDSPPWKSATTQTPTSFIGEDGRRKSGRTNPIPPELQPFLKNGTTPTRPTRSSQRQSEQRKNALLPSGSVANGSRSRSATTAQNRSLTNGRARPTTPTPKSSGRNSRASPKKPLAPKETPVKKSTPAKLASGQKSAPKATLAKSSAPPKKSPVAGTRKSARTAGRNAPTEEEITNGVEVKPESATTGRNGIDRGFEFESDGELDVDPDFRVRKIKLKFSIPKPIITHPSHIPTQKEFDSFEDFLDHDDISKNPALLAAAEEEAREEAAIRNKIEDAAVNGLLRPDQCSLYLPEKVPEPPQHYSHQDHLVAHALCLQRLLVKERKEHVEIMKKRNALVMAEIKRRRPLTKEEIEQEVFLENRRMYKEQISQLRRKWEEVLKEVENRRRMRAEEEHRLAGKQHLNQMLEHSTQLLEARRGDRHNSVVTASEGGLDIVEGEEEEGEYDEEDYGEEDEQDDKIVSELEEELDEANMSTTDSDEEEVEDDDESLTVEQLKAKYAGLGPSRASFGGKGLIQENDLSDIEDGMSLDDRIPVLSDVPSDDENLEDGVTRMDVDENLTEAVELEEVDDILMDDSDESVDMDSENESDDNEADDDEDPEDYSEGENGFGSGLLGLYGDLSGLAANSHDSEPESEDENELTEPAQEDRDLEKPSDSAQTESLPKNSVIGGSKPKATGESLEEDKTDEVSLVVYKSPPGDDVGDHFVSAPKVIEDPTLEIPIINGHLDTMDAETSTSLSHSQVDLKESGHPSSLTTSPETSPQPNIDIKTPIPFLLRGTLREYQHYGLDWLAGLYNNHTNGILADEMGLGKTIQTIALLAHLACEKEVWGPHLIVVPTSVMLNWEMEFKKWAPGFKILTYYGSREQRLEKRKGWFDNNLWHVCITSYQLVLQDQVTFKRRNWHYLILDEAHNIKNFRSQRWQTLLNFKAEARLLITGTPLQNNLIELWSLLYFLMPSGASSAMPAGFANLKEFQEWFAHPVDQLIEGGREGMDDEAKHTVTKLHRVLRPYLLRRLKADVEKQMPAKFEHIVYCRLSKRQRYLYEEFMSMAKTRETLASGNYLSIINCLMQLRKVCNHPDLFETRQIVTSFAMQKSVVADFEVKELLVRRRFLKEDPFKPFFSTNFLEFCGLVPAKNNHLSTQHSDEMSKLTATKFLQKYYEDRVTDIKPVEPDFTTVRGHAAYLEHQAEVSHVETLRSCVRLNRLRTQYRPLFGKNLVELCTDGVSVGPSKPIPKNRKLITDWFLHRSEVISSMIPTLEDRTESMGSLIDKFGCITPAVVATDMAPIALSPQGVELIQETQAKNLFPSDPFHKARVRLSIAFPDKRLLQYDCGKLQRLDLLLRQLQAGGHRALIFTQMTKVLDILEQFLNIHGHRYLRLDGATKVEQRQILTNRFNNDTRILVFILSTRSGGLGINLTGADTVIFYDLDWNPAMDKQCQDRCHRIGQTRDVHIYRFVSEYTIESNILRKSNQKRMLDDVVIQEGDFTTDYFNKLTIRDMLGDEVIKDLDGVDDSQTVVAPGVNMEKALEAAEDVEDVAAAKVAQREVMDADGADFAEKSTPAQTPKEPGTATAGSTSREPSASASNAAMTPQGNTVELEAITNRGLGHDIYGDGWNRVDREPVHIDEYMIRYMEWELVDVPLVLPSKSKKKKSKKGKKF